MGRRRYGDWGVGTHRTLLLVTATCTAGVVALSSCSRPLNDAQPVAVAAVSPGPAAPTASPVRGATNPPSPPLYNACTRNRSFYTGNPLARVLNDEFSWATYPPTKVGDGSGDIDWTVDPYQRVSWRMWLHSLRWLGTALDAANRGEAQATQHVLAIVRDWAKDNPYPWNDSAAALESTMHRTNVLLCLRSVLVQRHGELPPQQRWLDDVILTHARSLEEYFSGRDNHGTDESLVMLGVGCLLDRRHYRDLAVARLTEQLDHAIYPDGSVNEQSTGYAAFNYTLWNRVGLVTRRCTPGSPLATTVDQRLAALAGFLAHATTPQRTFHQLGDTEDLVRPPLRGTPHEYPATGGASGKPPAERVAIYESGYVFGRSGWGGRARPFPQESAYSIRFGPSQRHHGHSDHMSLTYQALGVPILIDSGHAEYTQDAWQAYVKGPLAHNQLVIPGMGDAPETTLTRSVVGAGEGGADYFRLQDSPAGGSRLRDVLVVHDPDLVVVADRGSSGARGTFQQVWQLPAGSTVSVARAGTGGMPPAGVATPTATPSAVTTPAAVAVAQSADRSVTTTFWRLPYRGAPTTAATASVVTGSTTPVQGWWWPTIFTRQPAPTLALTAQDTSVTMVTALVPGRAGTTVQVSVAPASSSPSATPSTPATPSGTVIPSDGQSSDALPGDDTSGDDGPGDAPTTGGLRTELPGAGHPTGVVYRSFLGDSWRIAPFLGRDYPGATDSDVPSPVPALQPTDWVYTFTVTTPGALERVVKVAISQDGTMRRVS